MVNRLVSVGDDFTLPAAVKAADANLPARLGATALSDTIDLTVTPAVRVEKAARRQILATVQPAVATSAPVMVLGPANATGGPIVGKTYHPYTSPVFRYKGSVLSAVTPGAIIAGHVYGEAKTVTAAGTRPAFVASFLTDAPVLEMDYLGNTAPKFRIKVDGAYVPFTADSRMTTAPATGSAWSPANTICIPTGAYIGSGSSHFARLTFADRRMRRIEIEGLALAFGGVYVGIGDTISATRAPAERWAWAGDSYSAGSGADVASTGYAHVASARLGVECFQSGAGGTGYLAVNGIAPKLRDRLATDIYPYNPDRVVIGMGINDGAFTPAQIGAEAALTYAALATNLPGVPVAVLTNWSPATPNASRLAIRDAILAAAQAAPNVDIIVDGTSWITGTGNTASPTGDGTADRFTSADGTHPTQAGHEYLGERVAEALAGV